MENERNNGTTSENRRPRLREVYFPGGHADPRTEIIYRGSFHQAELVNLPRGGWRLGIEKSIELTTTVTPTGNVKFRVMETDDCWVEA